MEFDFSDYVNLGILSQLDDNRILYPVAYFSKKLALIEYNYKIFYKELLAII